MERKTEQLHDFEGLRNLIRFSRCSLFLQCVKCREWEQILPASFSLASTFSSVQNPPNQAPLEHVCATLLIQPPSFGADVRNG